MKHYPTLDLTRVAAHGIDAEASTEAFLVECREEIPPRLLRNLGVVRRRHGSNGYKTGCRCDVCRNVKATEQARYRERRAA